jgi:hypothetical protein
MNKKVRQALNKHGKRAKKSKEKIRKMIEDAKK